jgi:hypothetical protein
MISEEKLKEFFKDKPGYLKLGQQKIQVKLMKKFGNHANGSILKETRKKLLKEYVDRLSRISAPANLKEIGYKIPTSGVERIPIDKFTINTYGSESISKPRISTNPPPSQHQIGMHVILGCNHVPFENKILHEGILRMMNDYKNQIVGFHLIGDFLDLNPLSSHDRGRFTAIPGLTLDMEYRAGNALLDAFERNLDKDVWKTYLYGNHEDRYNRWMSNMDNAKTPLISPENGLNLNDRGFAVKTNWSQDFFTIGNDFDIFHGIYFSIHNAKAHLDKLRRSCAYAHTHRIQNYNEGQMSAYNIGACADFTSKAFNYATRPMKAQWANGFAINMVDENGVSHVTQIKTDANSRFYFGGKLY